MGKGIRIRATECSVFQTCYLSNKVFSFKKQLLIGRFCLMWLFSLFLCTVLRQAFTRTGLLSPFAFCDEFSTVRLQHNRAITELMKAANRQVLNGVSFVKFVWQPCIKELTHHCIQRSFCFGVLLVLDWMFSIIIQNSIPVLPFLFGMTGSGFTGAKQCFWSQQYFIPY